MTCVVNSGVDDSFVVSNKSHVVLTTCYTVQWYLCNLTPGSWVCPHPVTSDKNVWPQCISVNLNKT